MGVMGDESGGMGKKGKDAAPETVEAPDSGDFFRILSSDGMRLSCVLIGFDVL